MSAEQPGAGEPIDADIVQDPAAAPAGGGPAGPDLSPGGIDAPTYEEVTGFTRDGVPTLDFVRDKIERRTAIALGTEELLSDSEQGRALDEQWTQREQKAKERLAQIRKSMGTSAD